jgi:3-dehydroquinate dehydratase-2
MKDGRPLVLVLNGPNLARLGKRDSLVYGAGTYSELETICWEVGAEFGMAVDVRQTEDEAEMLRWLHEAADREIPVVLNAGAWSHYSYALRDAVAEVKAPVIEVHLSQTAAREEFRHHSVISAVATGTITGLKFDSYRLALWALARLVRQGGSS